MSHIDDLIAELCSEGVPIVPLGELVRIRNGKDYKDLGRGKIPVYGTGGVMLYVDKAAHPGPSVLIPRKGSLDKLYYVDKPFWTVDTIFYTEIGDRLIPKFLYYFLSTQQLEKLNQAAGIPSLTQSVLNRLRIPVPPLEVQREIVRILDQFTQLEAELEAELKTRRLQSTYYRDRLLTFVDGVPIVPLGELVRIRNGKDYKDLGRGKIPVYGTGGVMLYVDKAAHPGPSVLIPRKGSLDKLYYVDKPFWTVDTIFYTEIGDRLIPKFLYYFLSTQQLEKLNQAAGIPSLTQSVLNRLRIPVPPLEVQREIVRILDQFTQLEAELEAESKARRLQSTYYRDRLLSFREAA